jgi:hypothetical protein
MPGIVPIDTPILGDHSHMVHDGRGAYLVDTDGEMWVHGAASYHASIAATILAPQSTTASTQLPASPS